VGDTAETIRLNIFSPSLASELLYLKGEVNGHEVRTGTLIDDANHVV
jgi:hypothetical protein